MKVPYITIRWVCDCTYLCKLLLQTLCLSETALMALYIPCQCMVISNLDVCNDIVFSKKFIDLFLVLSTSTVYVLPLQQNTIDSGFKQDLDLKLSAIVIR